MASSSQNSALTSSPSLDIELAKIPESFESEKAGVIVQTEQVLGRFGAIFGLTAALTVGASAMAASPYEPVTDGSRNFPLVLKETENPKTQADLFEAFDRNAKSEKRDVFSKLSQDQQKKTLSYYRNAKNEQPNEKAVLKGVYNLMSYYVNLKINEDALVQYKQTGKLPNIELPAVCGNALLVAQWFSNGFQYADVEKARQIDRLTTEIMKKEGADLKKEGADLKKESVKIQKDIDMLQALLKAL